MARVLVVDDDSLVRGTIRLALQRAKHEVLEAEDGEKALALLKNLNAGPVDLVITDIIMPEIDGIGLVTALHKRYPPLRILVISGGGRTRNLDFLRMAKELGAHATLPKPFAPEQLLAAVEEALASPPDREPPTAA